MYKMWEILLFTPEGGKIKMRHEIELEELEENECQICKEIKWGNYCRHCDRFLCAKHHYEHQKLSKKEEDKRK